VATVAATTERMRGQDTLPLRSPIAPELSTITNLYKQLQDEDDRETYAALAMALCQKRRGVLLELCRHARHGDLPPARE
jgi:hypothetical protein